MKKRAREEACSVCHHYHDYEGGEPCSVCGHQLQQQAQAPPSALPSEVLPGLYLGSFDHASRSDLLKTLGIENILNTVPSCQNLYKNSFRYCTVSATPPPLDECYDFIDEVLRGGGKVLVHCMAGINRSPAVVVYYVMRQRQCSLEEAHTWVKQRRPQINLTPGDAQRLQEAEAGLRGAAPPAGLPAP